MSHPNELTLGLDQFRYQDLFDPARLRDLHDIFDRWFAETAPAKHAQFDAYRRCHGEGMTPQQKSEALLAAAPFVAALIGKLFRIEAELEALHRQIHQDDPIWQFKRDFVKKRLQRPDAGKAWGASGRSPADARTVALAALADPGANTDEELAVARGVVRLMSEEETARKRGRDGAARTGEARRYVERVRDTLLASPHTCDLVAQACATANPEAATDAENSRLFAFVLDAIEAWLAGRCGDPSDPIHRWVSFQFPRALEFDKLVELRRPDPARTPELFVGPEHEHRTRNGFALSDRRVGGREAGLDVDYCLYCHDRDKDSCSKGLRDNKTRDIKKNPLGVVLNGCPLGEKISEMHVMRRDGQSLAALALVMIDNPMCAGTGHRICNDCMKACVYQKQDPVNIPQSETRVLTEVLNLPWGFEIYGLLTRWNPLNVDRPYARPYNGKNVLVVGLGPAGYTLAHHLANEGFGVVAIDGLKLEPLPEPLVGGSQRSPQPVRDFGALTTELDERLILGFGGVSEYGITVRWDKNFLTALYATLARNRTLRMYGGVRFGGTLAVEDAWAHGFDHVAIAAGAGRPTIIDVKNNLAGGIRKASDFLMGLQLTGAYKKTSLSNLQVSLPAIVIGGGLTAIDTATELLAYYLVQIEKESKRYEGLVRALGPEKVRAMFDDDEWATLTEHRAHYAELGAERERARAEGRPPRVQKLLDDWGGVSLCYRKGLVDSPAYRLNHEEVAKSLEEGVRYFEHLTPVEAVIDGKGHVTAFKFLRNDGSSLELPARTVCIAAGTSPNVIYEKEHPGTFELDKRGRFFQPHRAKVDDEGHVSLERAAPGHDGFFTSYLKDDRTVSFYGDNHPYYAGSVVKAMASAKDGHAFVRALFPDVRALDPASQVERDAKLAAFFARTDDDLLATVVHVTRLTETIVEVVVRAPLAARKFQPGQFYRLQNFESTAPLVEGTRLTMEGLALTGAWTDPDRGLLAIIVLEMGGSSRLCAALKPGERVVLMGPTGAPTEIEPGETVLLCGGGLGNAVLFSIARAFKSLGSKVLYFAGYKRGEDLFKQDDIECCTDQVIWTTDAGAAIVPRRPQDLHVRGNIVQAMVAYGNGELGKQLFRFSEIQRIIAIGSDRMMNAVREARHGRLASLLDPQHRAIGSINSPMQCMMKEVCAQCLQKHRDPRTGKEYTVFSCFNQDQELDRVDFVHLSQRLRANSMQEKLSRAWFDYLLTKKPEIIRI